MANRNNYGYSHRSNNKTKQIIIGVIIAVLLIGMAGTIWIMNSKIKTRDISSYSYEVGILDNQGRAVEDNSALRSKDFITADGLTVTVSENASVKYQLYFYDEDKQFVEASETLTTDYTEAVTEGVAYVKIVITPTADKDGIVSNSEVVPYADQIKVTVNR